ncbi:hypothetical protein C1T30_43135, partial [Bacillus sp. MBGLi97]
RLVIVVDRVEIVSSLESLVVINIFLVFSVVVLYMFIVLILIICMEKGAENVLMVAKYWVF